MNENSGKERQRARPEFVKAHTDFMRTELAVMDQVLAQHNHRDGVEGCPVCGPRGDGRRQRRADDLPALMPVDNMREPTRKCLCDGTRLSSDAEGKMYPCPRCNEEANQRWRLSMMGRDDNEGVVRNGS